MKMYKALSVLMITFLIACNDSITAKSDLIKEYAYIEDFDYYFSKNFKKTVHNLEAEKLFVIPVSSCTPCVEEVIQNLEENNCDSCALLFVGIAGDKERERKVLALSKKYTSFFDKKAALFQYQTNIGKPNVLFISKNKVYKMPLDYIYKDEIKNVFGWL